MAAITEEDRERGYRIERPNRDKAVAKATKATVILLLLVTAALVLVVTIGGWSALSGARPVQIAFIVLYVVMAIMTSRWSRGALPLAAAFAVILGIFAAVAGTSWYARDKPGFTNPALPSSVNGLVTLLIIPVQLLLIAFAMRAFRAVLERRRTPLDDDEDPVPHPGTAAAAR